MDERQKKTSYIQVTSTNIREVAEQLMMSKTELAIQYMTARKDGKNLVFEVEEET